LPDVTLVDTSVWVDHLRRANGRLAGLLDEGNVLSHPFVIGELACGNLGHRDEILALLAALPEAPVAHHAEVLDLVSSRKLYGQGLGWIDMHLMASALLAGSSLWTLDRKLDAAARRLA
jgi:predicted nucleic acid-binding protein